MPEFILKSGRIDLLHVKNNSEGVGIDWKFSNENISKLKAVYECQMNKYLEDSKCSKVYQYRF